MARKRSLFFHSSWRWITHFLLGLMVFCLVIPPILALNTPDRLQTSPVNEATLIQQGKTLYESGQFA